MKEELIHSDPQIMMGKPVIAGTRIPVELILEKLAAAESSEQILRAHPRVTQEAIQDHGSELLDAFTVISPGLIRIRPRV